MIEPHRWTATQAASALRDGRISATELVGSCLDRIARRDPTVQAWAVIDPDAALAAARAADAAPGRGPLHGIPVGIKDVFDTADFPTTYGSPLYAGFRPAGDARCVTLLRAAGAIVLGKTHTVEFASAGGLIPPTRNPHGLGHTPGGSSSGSAAAVADRMVPLALGTQTGGSMIRPASFNGVFALKPTFGTVPCDGLRAYAPSLDTVGWFARDIGDLALLAEAFALPQGAAAPATPVPRIGILRGPHWNQADGDAQAVLEDARDTLDAAGFPTCSLDVRDLADVTAAQAIVMDGEGAVSLRAEFLRFGDRLDRNLQAIAANAHGVTGADLRKAYDCLARGRVSFEAELERSCDAVLTLAAPGEAPEGFGSTGDALFNRPWTALGMPCLAMPFGRGSRGLPIGLQLVGARFDDRRLLTIGTAIAERLSLACPDPAPSSGA